MLRALSIVVAAIALLAACVTPRPEYEVATLILPEGSVHDGRDAFIELGCPSCHRVEWDTRLPEPVATGPAPVLSRRLVLQTSGGVATSILVPSHHVPAEYRVAHEGEGSAMADFTETMTVRQLIDLVAYLRAPEGRTVARVIDEPLRPMP